MSLFKRQSRNRNASKSESNSIGALGHALQTLVDALAQILVVGSIRYIDEAEDALKAAAKYGDEAAEAGKS